MSHFERRRQVFGKLIWTVLLLFTTTSNTVAFISLLRLGKSFGTYYQDGYVAEIGVYNRNITNT